MFRDLTRTDKQLPQEICVEILKKETRGVLSVLGDEDYPYGMPMNHWYNEADGCLYFHCGKEGHRVDSLRRHNKVSFCTFTHGTRENGHWALHVNSVIVFGRMELVEDLAVICDVTAKLSRKFTDDEAYIQAEIQGFAKKTLLLKLIPEHICGKAIKEA